MITPEKNEFVIKCSKKHDCTSRHHCKSTHDCKSRHDCTSRHDCKSRQACKSRHDCKSRHGCKSKHDCKSKPFFSLRMSKPFLNQQALFDNEIVFKKGWIQSTSFGIWSMRTFRNSWSCSMDWPAATAATMPLTTFAWKPWRQLPMIFFSLPDSGSKRRT